jgi:hypothetical protein
MTDARIHFEGMFFISQGMFQFCLSFCRGDEYSISSICLFRFPKILYQFLTYIIMSLCTICICSSLLSTRIHILSQEHLLCLGWRNFRTGVSCFSKTLFYFILLALTHGHLNHLLQPLCLTASSC